MSELPENFTLEFVSPRTIRLKMAGDFGGNAIHALFDVIDRHIGQEPYWLFEVDISELGHADPSARKAGAQRIGQTPEYSMALHGGSLAQRAVSMLFLKLAELFSGKRDVANTFSKDQASAQLWLEAEDRRRKARRSA